MKIAIYGCGAMGTVMGAYFAKNGLSVDMIDNYEAHVKKMNEDGAKIVGIDNFIVKVNAMLPTDLEGKYDLIFLFVKQTANSAVLPIIKDHLREDGIVCALQNGVPEYSVDEAIGGNRTVGGTVLWGATFMEAGVSEVTQDITNGDILFDIGEIDGSVSDRIKKVAEVLKVMGPVQIVDNLMGARWSKLILNSCMSGMSAAMDSVFGDILKNPKAKAALSYIASEIVEISDKAGIKLEPSMGMDMREFGQVATQEEFEKSQNNFERFYDDKRTAKASMLQDLEKNKKTEVDMINGFVVEQGLKYGIKTPYNNKIVEIIKGIEQKELKLSMENLDLLQIPNFD